MKIMLIMSSTIVCEKKSLMQIRDFFRFRKKRLCSRCDFSWKTMMKPKSVSPSNKYNIVLMKIISNISGIIFCVE